MRPQNLLDSRLSPVKCTTGSPILDRCLNGGIPCRSITEVVAESGSGKTQICLQIALHAQLPLSSGGLGASSLFLHTEFPFPSRRLHQLSLFFRASNARHFPANENPCDNVFVQSVQYADELLDVLRKAESFIAHSKSRFPIRLVIVDSIAALFRSEFDNTPVELKRRSFLFFKISAKLKAVAERFDLAVLVTNQVVDIVGPNDGINGLRIGNLGCLYTSGRLVCPALGLAWASCVNSRLFLSKNEEVVRQEDVMLEGSHANVLNRQTRRQLHVIFAPHLPEACCDFRITKEGISGVDR